MTALLPHHAAPTPRRVASIDFWRGLVLCTIFINHIPGNAFERLTQKTFGFSDSAEAFVFLSGVSLALAYAPRLAAGGAGTVALAMGRRAACLYGVHLFLSLAAIGIFAAGALAIGDPTLLDVHGRDLFVDDPLAALLGLVSLGHQLGYFNILPMYIVLLALAMPLLWIGRDRPRLMVALSFAIYLASRVGGLNIPTWPMRGTWFFDPFAWQFLMVIGLRVGLQLRRGPVPRTLPLTLLAAVVVALGAFSVTDGLSFYPGLQDWTRGWADLDKTTLGAGRLVHFAAMAYLVHALRLADGMARLPVFRPLCALGRHSLRTFAMLSLLAAVGQVGTAAFGHSLPLDGGMIAVGLAVLFGAVTVPELRRSAVGAPKLA